MMSSRHALPLRIRTAIGSILMLLGPVVLAGQSAQPRNNRNVRAQIEIEKSTYSFGDTARVCISLINTSAHAVGYVPMGPSDMIHLVVKRDGKLVPQNTPEAGTPGIQMLRATLDPHEPWPLGKEQWLPITDFGYNLQEVGRYTIEGVPQVGNQTRRVDTQSVRSNTVTFTITK
jgi:hypothetical protein